MMTTRIVLFGTLCFAAVAQTQPAVTNLGPLLEAAQKTEADWLTLASDLDSRLSRMLPCDARASRAIQETAGASAARLAAHAQYMSALVNSAAEDTKAARQMAAAQGSAQAGIPVERSDIAQEQAGIESQVLNLTASVRQRASLGAALEQLQQIQAMIAQRATAAANQAGTQDRLLTLLDDLVATFEKREEALRQQATAFDAERARWNAYYVARADRARLECTITGGGR